MAAYASRYSSKYSACLFFTNLICILNLYVIMINYFLLGCFLPEEVKLSEPLSGSMDQDSLDPPSKKAKLDYDHYVSPYAMSI